MECSFHLFNVRDKPRKEPPFTSVKFFQHNGIHASLCWRSSASELLSAPAPHDNPIRNGFHKDHKMNTPHGRINGKKLKKAEPFILNFSLQTLPLWYQKYYLWSKITGNNHMSPSLHGVATTTETLGGSGIYGRSSFCQC